MTSRHDRSGRSAGFTLIELLVAITVLSLLLVALSGGVHFAGQAWRAQEQRIDRQGDIHAVQNVLRQMLASGHEFLGDSGSLKFVGRLPAALDRGGLFDIEIYSLGDRLQLSWRPHFKGASAGLPKNEAQLLDGMAGFQISYFTAGKGWSRLAADKNKMPDLILIKAALSSGGGWPPLLIAPEINLSSKAQS